MRAMVSGLIFCMLAMPLAAQPISPLSGTTEAPVETRPTAPPATGPARHRSSRRESLAQRFESANITHDGKLTKEQARAGHMRAIARDFDQIDTEKHGYVTLDDIRAHNRARAEERRAHRQPATPQ